MQEIGEQLNDSANQQDAATGKSPSAAGKPEVSVVIPALDEAGNIGKLVSELKDQLDVLGLRHEVLVIDGGSRDDTWDEAQAAGAQCYQQRRVGFGGALREGMLLAKGDYIVTLDGDCSHPPAFIKTLWENRHKAEIIVGSRYTQGGSSDASAFRQMLSTLVNKVFARILSVPILDISSGYRLYRREVLVPEKYRAEDFNILQEILIKAYSDGYQTHEEPFHFGPRNAGHSHVDYLRFSGSYLKTLFRLWKLRNSVESADYDHRAYDSVIPLQRYWQRRRSALVNGFLEQGTILDIGCGSSRIIQGHPEAVAVDIAQRKLRFLRKTNRYLVRGSTFALPFPDKSFEQLIHSQVIEHVPYDAAIFREINRVLVDQGILVLGTPDYGRIWWPITEFFYGLLLPNAYADEHITHYTRSGLIDVLAEHGFRCLDYKYICGGELIIKARKVEHLETRDEVQR